MKKNATIATGVAIAALCTIAAIWWGGVRPAQAEGTAQTQPSLLQSREKIAADYDRNVAEIVRVLGDRGLRESDRATVVAAIELAGKLRAKEAVPQLVDLLLFGQKADLKDSPKNVERPDREPPDAVAPAVQALIDIGIPSLEPVCEKLAALKPDTENRQRIRYHCTWTLLRILGTEMGEQYLLLYVKAHPESKAALADTLAGFQTMRKLAEKRMAESK